MRLIIDIPNYNLDEVQNGSIASGVIIKAVKNGTPLPKGHGRLIDIDNIESIMLEDSVNRMVHTKGDEVDWYIEAPTIVEADKENDNGTDNKDT